MADFEPLVVPSFGGGLNFTRSPLELEPSEWSWSDGFVAKDGYAEVLPGYQQIRAGGFVTQGGGGLPLPTALLQNPFGWFSARPFVMPLVDTDGGGVFAVRLFTLDSNGGFDEITWDTAGALPTGDPSDALVTHGAFLNGFLVLNYGVGPGAVSMIRWNGGATFAGLLDAPRAYYLASHAGRLIAAVTGIGQTGIRSLAISDANSESVWSPALTNSADATTLDDARSTINGLAVVGDNLGVFTRGTLYQLSSTGAVPPFTRHVLQRRGCLDRFSTGVSDFFPMGPMLGETPRGTVFRGADDFYVAESGEGIGRKIFDYWRERDETTDATPMPQFSFHEQRGVLYVPVAQPDGGVGETLLFDPATGAWSRRTFPAGTAPYRHACLWDWPGASLKPVVRHLFCTTGQAVYAERIDGVAAGGEFVDTKDFRLPDPIVQAEVARLRVEWEPLTNATTDALDVLVAWRDDFSRGLLGAAGKQIDLSASMVSQGTLTGGAGELDIRGSGKILRIRFRRASGRARIRGFSIHYQGAGSDRKAA